MTVFVIYFFLCQMSLWSPTHPLHPCHNLLSVTNLDDLHQRHIFEKRWNKLRKQTKSQHPVDVAAKPQNPRVGENIDRTRANFFDTDVGGSRYRISILYAYGRQEPKKETQNYVG